MEIFDDELITLRDTFPPAVNYMETTSFSPVLNPVLYTLEVFFLKITFSLKGNPFCFLNKISAEKILTKLVLQ